MKRFVLAIALTGLMSVTVLAGEIPINGAPRRRHRQQQRHSQQRRARY